MDEYKKYFHKYFVCITSRILRNFNLYSLLSLHEKRSLLDSKRNIQQFALFCIQYLFNERMLTFLKRMDI